MSKDAETILIVEDNPINLKLLKDILEYSGYKTLYAVDGLEALQIIKENKKNLDLILMDLQLPEMGGLDVIKIVKSDKTTKNIPIFVISAYAMESDIEKAMKAGCNNYITKPINVEDFLNKINAFFMLKNL